MRGWLLMISRKNIIADETNKRRMFIIARQNKKYMLERHAIKINKILHEYVKYDTFNPFNIH